MIVFKKHYYEYLIILLVALFMTTFGGFFILNRIKERGFSPELFQEEQKYWLTHLDFPTYHQKAVDLYSSITLINHENFYQEWHTLITQLPSTHNTHYLSSSKKEIRTMADNLIENIYEEYPDAEFRFFDRIFARDPALSVLLNEPQSYLFVLSSSYDANLLIFTTMQPSLHGEIMQRDFWYFDQENPPSTDFLSNIFTIYHKKIR